MSFGSYTDTNFSNPLDVISMRGKVRYYICFTKEGIHQNLESFITNRIVKKTELYKFGPLIFKNYFNIIGVICAFSKVTLVSEITALQRF